MIDSQILLDEKRRLDAAPVYAIDSINGQAVAGQHGPLVIQWAEQYLSVSGWAVDHLAGDIAGSVYLQIGGRCYAVDYGLARPDVARAFAEPNYQNSGFTAQLPLSMVGTGRHQLVLVILRQDSQEYLIGNGPSLVIKNRRWLFFGKSPIDIRVANKQLAQQECAANFFTCRSRPYSAHILCQARCNYNCEFCGFDYRSAPLADELNYADFRKIIANLHPKMLAEVIFSGQGEPLLCHDLSKMVRHLRRLDRAIHIGITSNGQLLNDANQDLLAEYFDSVVISLHSVCPDTYCTIVSSDSCREVIANIYALRRANPRLPIVLYFAYYRRNIEEIHRHLELVAELGNATFLGAYAKFYSYQNRFSDRHNHKYYKTLDRNLSLFYHQEYSDNIIENAMDYAVKLGLSQAIFPPLFKNERSCRRYCHFPYTSVLVNYDGTIFPCGGSDVWMYEEIMSRRLNFGNLLRNDIDDLWNNKDYRRLRQSSAANCRERPIQRCDSCSTLGFLLQSGNIPASHFIAR